MTALIIILAALFFVALVLGWLRALKYNKEGRELPPVRQARPDGCCGKHAVCEKLQYSLQELDSPTYYDDEELDRYRGRPSDKYSPTEAEEFRTVLYELAPAEVEGWLTSLERRGVDLPDEVKDEAFMLMEGNAGKG